MGIDLTLTQLDNALNKDLHLLSRKTESGSIISALYNHPRDSLVGRGEGDTLYGSLMGLVDSHNDSYRLFKSRWSVGVPKAVLNNWVHAGGILLAQRPEENVLMSLIVEDVESGSKYTVAEARKPTFGQAYNHLDNPVKLRKILEDRPARSLIAHLRGKFDITKL